MKEKKPAAPKEKKVRRKLTITEKTKERAVKIIDSALSAGYLLLALRIIVADSIEAMPPIFLLIYLLLTLSKILQSAVVRKTDRLKFTAHIVFAVIFVVAGVLPMIFGLNAFTGNFLVAVYYTSILVGRIIAIVRKRTPRNIIINALAGVVLILLIVSTLTQSEEALWSNIFVHAFLLAAAALSHIVSISFSQMRFSILQKIIRKTFAAEILFGLALLIVSFSFVFVPIEASIETYADALWYCFAIVTTIGFGDLTAVTLIGRLLSVILGIYGIIVVSLITSVIVNFYNEVKDVPDDVPPPPPPEKERPAEAQQEEEETP